MMQHDDDAAPRHGSRCRRARPVRPRRLRQRPHGLRLVVDLCIRADDRPQAPAPTVPGDLLVTHDQGDAPRPPGQPGGLFRVSGPHPTPDRHRTTARPTSTKHRHHRHESTEQGEMAMFAFEYHRSHRTERWRVAGALRGQLVRARRPVLLGAARRHPARQGLLPSSARCGAQCLDAAIERREPWGVWGGELFANGKVLAQKRRRGRPPKVRPPEPVLEELVPVVPRWRRAPERAHSHRKAGRGNDGRGTVPPVPQRAPARRGQSRVPLPISWPLAGV